MFLKEEILILIEISNKNLNKLYIYIKAIVRQTSQIIMKKKIK